MANAFYPGSFDPVTLGHLDVIEYASQIFDKVCVALVKNSDKNAERSKLRYDLLVNVKQHFKNVFVYDLLERSSLSVVLAKELDCSVLIRGVRDITDLTQEMQLAMNNKVLAPEINTIWIPSNQNHLHISSSVLRKIIRCMDGDKDVMLKEVLKQYIPEYNIPLIVKNRRNIF